MASRRGIRSIIAIVALLAGCSDDGTASASGDTAQGTTTGVSSATMSGTAAGTGGETGGRTTSGPTSDDPSDTDATGGTGESSSGGSGSSSGSTGGSSSSSGGSSGSSSSSESGVMTTTGLEEGECNETLGVGCDDEEYCDYPDDNCGAGEHGVCTPLPEFCTDDKDPHCGCDGFTHSNSCEANAAGTDIDHAGAC